MTEGIGAEDDCVQCGHPFGPHVVVAEEFKTLLGVEDVPIGGHIHCPVEDCDCSMTWSLDTKDIHGSVA